MRCRHLTRDDLEAVHAAFLAAFADYAVAQQPTRAALQAMLRRRGIAWERSVGVESERGFAAVMAVGVDAWQGAPTAYDIFTGVRPESRGQGLAGEMLRFALPGLRARGVRRFVLEVLEGNASALAAYRRVGFAVTRDLQCFTLPRATVAAA
ncbi:MAG: GNAT family N-acetyltransferase, partial [Myxococcales bacterium]|nr:GNAT family N-acetyltransferase [Myxococcales bacterium]